MKPIRVLHIINTLERGGAEQHLLTMFKAYDPDCVRPSVVTLYDRMALAPQFRAMGFSVISLGMDSYHQALMGIARLYSIITAVNPDIIQTALIDADVIGRVAAKLAGYQGVVTAIHSPVYEPVVMKANPQLRWWKMFLVRQIDRLTSRILHTSFVGCSQYVMQSIQASLRLNDAHCRVIYNGVNVPTVQDHPPHSKTILINVGRLVHQKGQAFLIAAMPYVLEQYPDVELWIVGDGWKRDALHQQIHALRLEKSVHLLGKRADVFELLRSSSIFVFPSLYEAMPIAPLEAMAACLPIVASDILPHREILTNGVQGLLVPPQNPQALADAIMTLLADPEQARHMGAAGRQRIVEQFDINVTVRQWEAFYCEMLRS